MHHRHRGGSQRQRHAVIGLLRHKPRYRLAVDSNILQRIIGERGHRKRQGIGGLRLVVGSRYHDGRRTIDRCSLRNLYALLVFLLRYRHDRRSTRTIRQRHLIGGVVGIEVLDRLAVHLDTRQVRVGRSGTNELNAIRRGAAAIGCCHGNQGGRTIQHTIGNLNLATAQLTTGETGRLALGIGKLTFATTCLDIRRHGSSVLTQAVGLLGGGVGVEAQPLLAVDVEVLYLRRINHLHIIDIQTVTVVQTAVGTEVGIVRGREDDIHLLRRRVAHVVDRHLDQRPVAVRRARTKPALGHLGSLGRRTAFVSIGSLTDIALLVVLGYRRTVTVLTLELITL